MIALLLAVVAAHAQPTAIGPGDVPAAIVEVAREVRNRPLPARIDAISKSLLGVPYLDDPIGEGVPPDVDPIVRYDGFDCLTYVEEVLSLALTGDPAHAAMVRNSLRYDGDPATYANRQHFMELQWIPRAVANGWLRDTTREYGETVRFERTVTDATWAAWSGRARFALTDDELPTGTMALDVLPLAAAQAAAAHIRPGSIVMTVRQDRSWIPIWITHLGFVVPGATLRHASRLASSRTVREHDLAPYLRHTATYTNWPTAGIVVFEPVEQGPRDLLLE